MTTILEPILLGALQGLTEFLPVSSSGHLILAGWAAGWDGGPLNSLTFDVALHVGTLIAVLGFFRDDWLRLGRALLSAARYRTADRDARFALYLALATLPAVAAGLLLERTVETLFRGPLPVCGALVAGSLAMWLSDRFATRRRGLSEMTLGHALFIGVAQAVALVPGISRSGITISAALAAGYRREEAARYSFLLAMPVISGAAVLKLRHLTLQDAVLPSFALGVLSAAVVGYFAIRFLVRYLERHSLNVFVGYRLALVLAVLALWAARN